MFVDRTTVKITDWTIYGPKLKKSFEKDFSVRISCRTLAQSIPEGLENKMALGAKIKKNYENFFYDPLMLYNDQKINFE